MIEERKNIELARRKRKKKGCGWKKTAGKGWSWTPLGGDKDRRGLEVSSARRGEREEGK